MKVIDASENTIVYGHEFGTYSVRTEVPVNEDKEVVMKWHPSSTLYPEFLPRWTGNWVVKLVDGEEVKEKEIVFDIPNLRSGWYVRWRAA